MIQLHLYPNSRSITPWSDPTAIAPAVAACAGWILPNVDLALPVPDVVGGLRELLRFTEHKTLCFNNETP